jgi:hypothetical protein
MRSTLRSFGDRMLGTLLRTEVASAVYCPHSGSTCATSCWDHGASNCEFECQTFCYSNGGLCWTSAVTCSG